MRRKTLMRSFIPAIAAGLFLACAAAAAEKSASEFFRGKKIRIYTHAAGGGTDTVTRSMAPFLEKELGATVIVKNSSRGNIIAANDLFRSKPDGLSLAIFSFGVVSPMELSGVRGIKYKTEEFNWLGFFGIQELIFVISPAKPYRTAADFKGTRGLKIISASPMGMYTAGATLAAWALDLDAKVITGARTPEMILSVQKGESDGAAVIVSAIAPFIKGGQVRPLFAFNQKTPVFPDLPTLSELTQLSEQQRLIKELFTSSQNGLLGPPGIPKDRLDYLAKTLEKINKDQAAQKVLSQRSNLTDWVYMTYEESQKFVKGNMKLAKNMKLGDIFKAQRDRYR